MEACFFKLIAGLLARDSSRSDEVSMGGGLDRRDLDVTRCWKAELGDGGTLMAWSAGEGE